jgi:hypothetical protein
MRVLPSAGFLAATVIENDRSFSFFLQAESVIQGTALWPPWDEYDLEGIVGSGYRRAAEDLSR